MLRKLKLERMIKSMVFLLVAGISFISCYPKPDNKVLVEREVSKIIPFNGFLWFVSSNLYKKDATPSSSTVSYNGQWSLIDAKCEEIKLENISSIATDGSYLYCYVTETIDNVTFNRVYSSTDGEHWTQIDISSFTGFGNATDSYAKDTSLLVFDNKAGNGSNNFTGRRAYVRLYNKNGGTDGNGEYEVHALNGTSVGSVVSGSDSNSVSAAYSSGITFFSDSVDMIGCNGMVYKTSNTGIQYSSDGNDWTSVNLNKGTIYSLELTADYFLIGTEKGLFRVGLTDGVPSSETTAFSNNTNTLFNSKITGIYALNRSVNEGTSDEYVVMPVSKYVNPGEKVNEIGLYAYYPNQGQWAKDID